MYVKELILFIFGVGLYNAFYANVNGQQKVVRDLQLGVVVQFAVGVIGLLGASFMIDFLLSTNAVLPARFYGSEQEYRLYNITATAFFQLSLFYLMLLHFLLAYNAKHNTLPSIFSVFYAMYRINFRTYIPSVIRREHFSVFQMALYPITIAFAILVYYWPISYQKTLMWRML